MLKRLMIALSLLALVAALAACGDIANGQEPANTESKEVAVPVEVASVTQARVYASYYGTATLEAETEAQVVAKTPGIVLEILVEEGDRVAQGQIVAKLDREQLVLEVRRAEATLQRLENEFKRAAELFEKSLVSSDAYEDIRSRLETERATYELTKLNLSYTDVRTPIGGVVSQRLVKLGKLVALHEPLFRVDDFDPLLAILHVPERELATLNTGQEARLQLDALGKDFFVGYVERISPVVDPQTGTSKVTVAIEQPDRRLKPGMFGRVNIIFDQREHALTVPEDAVVREDDSAYVYRVSDSRAERVDVVVGYTTEGRVEMVEGLQQGQWVVTSGKGSIGDNTLLEVIKSDSDRDAAPVAATAKSKVAPQP